MELLTAEEVAHLLKISRRRVYVLVEHPDLVIRLPHVRIGRRALRFSQAAIAEYIERRSAA